MEFGRRRDAKAIESLIPVLLRQGPAAVPEEARIPVGEAAFDRAAMMLVRVQRGDASQAEAALQAWRHLADLFPATHRLYPSAMANLAVAQMLSGLNFGSLSKVIECYRLSIQATPRDDPQRLDRMHGIAVAARERSGMGRVLESFGQGEPGQAMRDIELAVHCFRQVLAGSPRGSEAHVRGLGNLADALHRRFLIGRNVDDLDEALEVGHEVLGMLHPDNPALHNAHANLADLYRARFTARDGLVDLPDLNRAIEQMRRAVETAPPDDPPRAQDFDLLDTCLYERYLATGDPSDLDEAIRYGRRSLEATSPDDEDALQWSERLHRISSALYQRALLADDLADLDESIALTRRLVTIVGTSEHFAYRGALGTALLARHLRTGVRSDLDEAIAMLGRAVEGNPDHPAHASHLAALAAALGRRSERGDLDMAIELNRQALALTAPAHPGRLRIVVALVFELCRRYRERSDRADLDEAGRVAALATDDALTPPVERVWSLSTMARELAGCGRIGEAADLMDEAAHLLPLAAGRRLDDRQRQRLIADYPAIAAEAAVLRLRSGTRDAPEAALRVMESGRAVLLSQRLEVRGDLSDLRERYPELAERFAAAAESFDAPIDDTNPQGLTPRSPSDRRHEQADRFAAALTEIRSRPGFEDFLATPAIERLLAAANRGPIIMLPTCQYGTYALIIRESGVESVALPQVGAETLRHNADVFQAAIGTLQTPEQSIATIEAARARIGVVLAYLWDGIAQPVLDRLGLRPWTSGPWPRIWWIPSGLLTRLPLHAAGASAAPSGRRVSLTDYAISSYIPTIKHLGHARERAAATTTDVATVVAMASTPGRSPLPNVAAEAAAVRAALESRVGRTVALSGPAATADRVAAALAGSGLAHFACHADSRPDDPMSSAFYLHDHASNPFTLARIAAMRLNRAGLAYLSACHTAAVRADHVLDESLQLTSACLLAGFGAVVGSLWAVDDEGARKLAEAFYARFAAGGEPMSPDRSAAALHLAIRSLRERDHRFDRPDQWAAWVHSGA